MRFMMIMYPEIYQTAKAGWVPDLKSIEKMQKYNEELQKAGVLRALDGLTPPATMSTRFTFKDGKTKVTDGPFPEAKEVIGGYWVIDVKSREEALEWASRIPGQETEMVEVRRFFEACDFGAEAQHHIEEFEKTANQASTKAPQQRYMLIVFPKIYETAQAGWLPDMNDESAGNFAEELQKAGVLVTASGLTPPATMSARVTFKNGKSKVTDGPFPESKEVVGGFWVIDVKSVEEALKIASRIPDVGSEMVEVRRFFDLSDFGAEAQQEIVEFDQRVNQAK